VNQNPCPLDLGGNEHVVKIKFPQGWSNPRCEHQHDGPPSTEQHAMRFQLMMCVLVRAYWYVQNVSTFPNTFAIVSPLICVFWIQLTRTNTTRKTLIHGPIIYGALHFGAPRISSRGASSNMRHRYHLMCVTPNEGCAMHMWAPPSTIAGGVRPPHSWRMKWECATHMADISGAPHFHAPRI
jgi:hypothetical protein